ncbi:hypothetical protein GCM10027060_26530 [Nesterenkonia halophila]
MHLTASATNAFASIIANVPNPSGEQPPGMDEINTILDWAFWLGLAACVAGLIAGGALMAIQSRRGEGSEHAGRIAMACIGAVVIGAASMLIGALA